MLLLCIALGALLRRMGRVPAKAHLVLNSVVLDLALPAFTFVQIRKLPWDSSLLFAAATPWIVFLGAMLLGLFGYYRLGWSKATAGTVTLLSGLGNTSFLGFPLLRIFYGEEAIPIALIADQLGSFFVVTLLGVTTAALSAGKNPNAFMVLSRIVRFPALSALLLAFLSRGISIPAPVLDFLTQLGSLLLPLALISVGMQLQWNSEFIRKNRTPLLYGLSYRLAVAPLVILGFSSFGLLEPLIRNVSILESGMAPMVTAAIIAEQYELNAELAVGFLAAGIPLSLMTVPLWYWGLS